MHEDLPAAPPATEARGASSRGRVAVFALIASTMVAIAGAYVARRALLRSAVNEPGASSPALGAAPSNAARFEAMTQKPHVVFRNLESSPAEDFGKLALSPIDPSSSTRLIASLRCVRVHFAAGKGICLEMEDEGGRVTRLHTFGADLEKRWTLPVDGLPSRARVAPDGRYGAVTLFVTGHSYSDEEMSTATLIVDMAGDRLVGDIEKFEVLRDGAPFLAPDFNLWGVTFAPDSNRFHATLASGGKTWLVEGDVAARRMKTIRENVECPSMSPDGKRLAFKKRVGGPGAWRIHLLDLATLEERLLAGEERAIDDQIEWLDDEHILYKHGASLWSLPLGGAAPAREFLSRASSPAVVLPPG